MKENYMDKFATPEEFIRHEVLANRGTKSIVQKGELMQEVMYLPNAPEKDYDAMTKAELFDLLVELTGEKAYTLFPVGVGSYSFQLKFGVEHKDVLKMAKAGFIKATGEHEFRLYGRTRYAKTYSPKDYFRLTAEEVHEWLAAHSRRK